MQAHTCTKCGQLLRFPVMPGASLLQIVGMSDGLQDLISSCFSSPIPQFLHMRSEGFLHGSQLQRPFRDCNLAMPQTLVLVGVCHLGMETSSAIYCEAKMLDVPWMQDDSDPSSHFKLLLPANTGSCPEKC